MRREGVFGDSVLRGDVYYDDLVGLDSLRGVLFV